MHLVPRVSGEEIQALVQARLLKEVVVKTDGWQGYSFLDALPYRHEWLVPGSGKEAPKVLPWVHTLIANIKGNIRGVHHGVSPKHIPRYLAEILLPLQPSFLGTANVQADASGLLEYLEHYILGAKAISVFQF